MSNSSKNFTKEEKAAIALKAASGQESKLQELAEEHGISVEEIRNWMRETGVTDVNDDDSVSIEVTDDYDKSVTYGASFDTPNYQRIVFWSAFGSAVVLLIIVSVFYVHSYTTSNVADRTSEESQFYNIEEIQQREAETLNSYGVVDSEEGIYRIPIDQAISEIVNESN
ncbi:hypothetical protein [Rhodohalobacter barkolensis]|uniref:Uncharacterized protein n=1 Tax=Rhodohalobacter barkolensis TaxID=2053187 RepID=A0A2N0VJ40_9BACT|nr:hypothetical protein [Rhodohalobacter barkolensis]PKD44203.1 hypothetical protein CWD77_01670 [Rhodohalobacter barkolensis]